MVFCEYINLLCLCLLDCDKVKIYFKDKGIFWGKWKDKNYIEKLKKDFFIDWLKDDYMNIEVLKLMWKKWLIKKFIEF